MKLSVSVRIYLYIFLNILSLAGLVAQDLSTFDNLTSNLTYRNVGPTRGGRVTAVAGHPSQPSTFYLGSTGGGVWKTTNYGRSWKNISDGYFLTGSIGAIAVAPSNPEVIYTGTGSDGIRSNVIIGKGVYKSTDSGQTWQHLGLKETGQTGAVLIHPENPQIVMVAALGNPFIANPERGVFRSTDGGSTWTKVLFISDSTGAVDLEFAPDDPQIVYASMWLARRKPWTIISGGHEGGIYKSTDGGVRWKKLTKGLPGGLIGKSDLAVSRQDPNRLWALIEAPEGEGGVYRSDDRGESFTLISTKKELVDRPFYFCNIDANPQDANSIYVGSTAFWHSVDGGMKWQQRRTPHADNHDMWINPADSNLYIQANDGGACVTTDGGKTWSSIENQPTAELYTVAVDDQFPYWLYSGQQDNTTIALPSLPPHNAPGGPSAYWLEVGGCETGPAVPKPGNPDIVYANCKGRFGVYDKRTGQERQYYVGAANIYGHNPRDLEFRFQRVAPIHVSPHNPDIVYHASQYLHKTTDEGKTWEIISPDLTAFTPETQVISGSPITRDITGEEYFSTIYAVQESPVQEGVIWVGANDGPVHLTLDGGKNWKNITPGDLPPYGRVQTVEPSPFNPAKAYIAVYRYLLGDFRPYIYKTVDFGESWQLLTNGRNGIPPDYPTRVIREDPNQEGLLYAGTEFGMFISLDDGKNWQSFQKNLPVTPVTDIRLKDDDLVLSTMGRSFWIMDDINILRQIPKAVSRTILFHPGPAYRLRYRSTGDSDIPAYPEAGMAIRYYLHQANEKLQLRIFNADGDLVRNYQAQSGQEEAVSNTDMATGFQTESSASMLDHAPGAHTLHWDLRHETLRSGDDRRLRGPIVSPGRYRIDLIDGLKTHSTKTEVLADPRILETGISEDDLKKQEMLSLQIQRLYIEAREFETFIKDQISENKTSLAIEELRAIQSEITTAAGRYPQPRLISQISYLYNMLDQADQLPGRDAYQRYTSLRQQLESLKKRAGVPGIMD
jgi:photosystem II stability/assembly factor-like uncharacterized protein